MMEHGDSQQSVEASLAAWRRRQLIVWSIRQVITLALILWLFPKYRVLWWSLIVIVPVALFTLRQILKLDRIVEKGRNFDRHMRQADSLEQRDEL